jgi:hypothetical protein
MLSNVDSSTEPGTPDTGSNLNAPGFKVALPVLGLLTPTPRYSVTAAMVVRHAPKMSPPMTRERILENGIFFMCVSCSGLRRAALRRQTEKLEQA